MTIVELVQKSHQQAVTKGWWDEDRSLVEALMLVVGELSEAVEELRDGRQPGEIYSNNGKLEGVPIELADALIRLGDLCGEFGIPLQTAIDLKLKFNETRPYRHGGKKI